VFFLLGRGDGCCHTGDPRGGGARIFPFHPRGMGAAGEQIKFPQGWRGGGLWVPGSGFALGKRKERIRKGGGFCLLNPKGENFLPGLKERKRGHVGHSPKLLSTPPHPGFFWGGLFFKIVFLGRFFGFRAFSLNQTFHRLYWAAKGARGLFGFFNSGILGSPWIRCFGHPRGGCVKISRAQGGRGGGRGGVSLLTLFSLQHARKKKSPPPTPNAGPRNLAGGGGWTKFEVGVNGGKKKKPGGGD